MEALARKAPLVAKITIVSSWLIDDEGYVYPIGGKPNRANRRMYHCKGCGQKGHAITTCKERKDHGAETTETRKPG